MLDGLLALARAEHQLPAPEPVELAALVEAEVAAADTAGLRVTRDLEPAVVDGEPTLLALLVRNLLHNAVRYNTPDGWLRVEVAARTGRAVLTVANSGPPVADVPRLFEPFRRGAGERTGSADGSGLGLSIVRAVARAHGGDVTAESGGDGGLTVRVVLSQHPGKE